MVCSTSYSVSVPRPVAHRATAGRQQRALAFSVAVQPLAGRAAHHFIGAAPAAAHRDTASICTAHQRERRHESIRASANGRPPVQDEKDEVPPAAAAASSQWLDRIAARWRRLSPQQQVYAVIAGVVLSVVLWQLLTLGVVLLERLLLGSLVAAEEALLSVLLVAAGLFLVFAAFNAVTVGAYLLGGGSDNDKQRL